MSRRPSGDRPSGEPQPWPFSPSDEHGWPDHEGLEPSSEFDKAIFNAKLEVRKKRAEQAIERANADFKLQEQYYAAVLEVGKTSIERARAGAETVQKASAAIVTLYTGVLALAFSVAERPLPFRALFAAALLGLAIVLSASYVAYLPSAEDAKRASKPGDEDLVAADRRAVRFIRWTREAARKKRKWLNASVVALGASLFFLPAPFVVIGAKEATEKGLATWPDAPTVPTDAELRKILYTAQVAEVAEQRKDPIAAEEQNSDLIWWAGFAFALLLVVVIPQLSVDRFRRWWDRFSRWREGLGRTFVSRGPPS